MKQTDIWTRSIFVLLSTLFKDSRSGHSNGGLTLGYGYSGSLTGTYNQTGSQGDYMTGRPPSEYSLPSQPSPREFLFMLVPYQCKGMGVRVSA